MESPKVAPYFNVYRPMDLAAAGRPLPIVVWANGGCVRDESTWKEPLLERWAAAGYFVLALTATADGNIFATSTTDDQKGAIDWAVEQSSKADGMYAGKLDTTKIMVSGNSCGGVTSLELAARDERVSLVFVLSGSSALGASDMKITSAIKAPVGFVVGSDDDVAAANAISDYDLLTVPEMLVRRSTGDHNALSSDPAILKDVAEIALNWMDLAFFGQPEALQTLNSPTVCASCQQGVWTLKSKMIDTLQK